MATSQQPYPFDDAWKASVDRSGFEWMAYCEAAFAESSIDVVQYTLVRP